MKTKKNSDLKIGEIVVYPKHGVGEIAKIETMEISNIKTSFYVVKMEQSKLTIRVPLDKNFFKKNYRGGLFHIKVKAKNKKNNVE